MRPLLRAALRGRACPFELGGPERFFCRVALALAGRVALFSMADFLFVGEQFGGPVLTFFFVFFLFFTCACRCLANTCVLGLADKLGSPDSVAFGFGFLVMNCMCKVDLNLLQVHLGPVELGRAGCTESLDWLVSELGSRVFR